MGSVQKIAQISNRKRAKTEKGFQSETENLTRHVFVGAERMN
jgi:hypothetical protein